MPKKAAFSCLPGGGKVKKSNETFTDSFWRFFLTHAWIFWRSDDSEYFSLFFGNWAFRRSLFYTGHSFAFRWCPRKIHSQIRKRNFLILLCYRAANLVFYTFVIFPRSLTGQSRKWKKRFHRIHRRMPDWTNISVYRETHWRGGHQWQRPYSRSLNVAS